MSRPLLLFISLTEPVLCALRVNSVISSFFSVSLTSCNINYNLVGSMCEWKPLLNTLEITDLETAHTKRNFERIVSNCSIQYSFKTRDGKGQLSERPWKPRAFSYTLFLHLLLFLSLSISLILIMYRGRQKYWYGISNEWGLKMAQAMPIKLFAVIYKGV